MMKPENNEKHIPSDGKSQALAISISMLLLLAISAISLSFWNSYESSHDAVAINLAGRQRMLSQRIAKDLLRLEIAKQNPLDTELILQDLSHSYFLFDQTLTMLGHGNLVTQDGTTITITASKSSKAIELIAQANAIWAPMQAALLPVITSSVTPSSATLQQALLVVLRDNQRLLLVMNSLTAEIENAAHKKSEQLRLAGVFAIGLILLNFGFVLFYFRRQLSLLSESKLLSMRIMENVCTAIIVISSKGDIELCNHAAERLFKYRTGKLVGDNIRSLIEVPYFNEIGKRTNGELFALDIELSEMYAAGRTIFIVSLYDLTEQKLREEQLSQLAYHDPLTGLPNRLLFMDRLAQSIAKAHRNNELTAIFFIDLDRFKQVNDTLGHAIGDLLLQEVATRLMNCLREGDTITRLGGDEFAMIIDRNDIYKCAAIANKVLATLSNEFHLNGHTVKISGSLGASLYPNDSNDINALLHYADIAMYRAKAQGGNTFCIYSEITPVSAT